MQLSGPQADVVAELFSTSTVRWRDVPRFVRTADRGLGRAQPTRIEDAGGSYVVVRRSSGDARVTINVYVGGPRRSGSAELTTTGAVVSVHVS